MPRSYRRTPYLLTVLTACVALVPLSGCSMFSGGSSKGPTPEEAKIENLSQSVDLLRQTLRSTAEERDTFKQRYLNLTSELRARTADAEYLEARVRLHRQEIQDLGMVVDGRDAQLGTLNSELATQRALLASTQAELDHANEQKNELSGECARLESKLAASTEALEKLEKTLSVTESKVSEQQASVSQATTAIEQELQASRAKIEQLNGQITTLKADLVAAGSQGTSRPPVTTTTPSRSEEPVAVVRSEPTEPAEASQFLVSWGKRSWEQVRRGEWNESNLLMAGILAGALLLILVLMLSMIRSRRARKQVREMRDRLMNQQARTQPAATVASTSAVPVARRAPAPAQTPVMAMAQEPTIEMPSVVPPTPNLPVQPLTQPMGAAVTDAAAPTMQINEFDLDPAVTQHIDIALDEAEVDGPGRRGRTVMGATGPNEGGVNEEALLADLKSVISEKFTELKDGGKK